VIHRVDHRLIYYARRVVYYSRLVYYFGVSSLRLSRLTRHRHFFMALPFLEVT